MNISELLITSQPTTTISSICSSSAIKKQPIHDDDLMALWEQALRDSGFLFKGNTERNSLTDGYIWPHHPNMARASPFLVHTPLHIKVIGRHMNGSFRCHIGTGKASRPIQSIELCRQMRLLAVFFRAESSKSQLVSPEFIFFPTWLLHLFRYTEHGATPGRTDVRFLENAALAKEDHIYRLNNVLNTLFRFNLHDFDHAKLRHAVELANYLFDAAGLDHQNLPRPSCFPGRHDRQQPSYYSSLVLLLQAPRPSKLKPMCSNCNAKSASRRGLCVACYRYQLKHGEPRPLRLIVASRPGPRVHSAGGRDLGTNPDQSADRNNTFLSPALSSIPAQPKKHCANCGVQETHQWYRNLCGSGHWCETCKSYYLRHTKVRPPELFVKAAKRKVDVRTFVNWSDDGGLGAAHDHHRTATTTTTTTSGSSSPAADSIASSPTTPPPQPPQQPSLIAPRYALKHDTMFGSQEPSLSRYSLPSPTGFAPSQQTPPSAYAYYPSD